MGKIISDKERLAEGMKLEKSDDLEAASALYRKIADKNPLNQQAVSRLLVIYRKLKDYREELALINRVLAAYKEQDRVRQTKWIQEHSKAAAAGTAVFQKLGGASVSGFGSDPVVAALTRRRETVEQKISGKKGVRRVSKPVAEPATRKGRVQSKGDERKRKGAFSKREELQQKETAAKQRKQQAQKQQAALEQRNRENRERREAAESARRQRKAEAAAIKAEKAAAKKAKEEAAKKAEQEKRLSSLFVITLSYRVPLKKIDAAMAAHVAFLNKHYEKGDFLVSGRQEPRVGGIILSRGKARTGVERMMQADPFVKKGLADVEVVEFKASQMGKELSQLIGRKK
jgi:uncharacterized protein YciI